MYLVLLQFFFLSFGFKTSGKQKGREGRRYNPADPNDWKIVQSLLEEVEDDIDGDFDPYSDEEEDIIETRN